MSQVQISISGMMPELIDLKKKRIFDSDEIRTIVQTRTQHEYNLIRKKPILNDFMRYIQYEIKIELIRRQRRSTRKFARMQKYGVSDRSILKRTFTIFSRALQKFPNNLQLWFQFIEWAMAMKEHKQLMYILPRALRFHPLSAQLWLKAAMYEYEISGDIGLARMYFQRGLRLTPKSIDLWLAFFHMEVSYIGRVAKRKVLQQVIPDVEKQQTYAKFVKSVEKQAEELNKNNDLDEAAQQQFLGELLQKQSLLEWTPDKAKDQISDADRLLLSGAVAKTIYDNACKAFLQMTKVVNDQSELEATTQNEVIGMSIEQKLSFLQLLTTWRYGQEEEGLGKERHIGGEYKASVFNHRNALRSVKLNEQCLALCGVDIYGLYKHVIQDIFVTLHANTFDNFTNVDKKKQQQQLQSYNIASFWDAFARLALLCPEMDFDFPADVLQQVQVNEFLTQEQKNNSDSDSSDSSDSDSSSSDSDTDSDEDDDEEEKEMKKQFKQQLKYQQKFTPLDIAFPTFPLILPQSEQRVIVRYFLAIKMYSAFPMFLKHIPGVLSKLFAYLLERIKYYFTLAKRNVNVNSGPTKAGEFDLTNYDLCNLLTVGYALVDFTESMFTWAHALHYQHVDNIDGQNFTDRGTKKIAWINASILIEWLTLKTTTVGGLIIYKPSTPQNVTQTTKLPTFATPYNPFDDSTIVLSTQQYKAKSMDNVLLESLYFIKSYLQHLQFNKGNVYTLTSDMTLSKSFQTTTNNGKKIEPQQYDVDMEKLISILYSTYINFIIRPYTTTNQVMTNTDIYKQNIANAYTTLLDMHTLILTIYYNCITQFGQTILPFSYPAVTLFWDSFIEMHRFLIVKINQVQITNRFGNNNNMDDDSDSTDSDDDSSSSSDDSDSEDETNTTITRRKITSTRTINHYEYNTWFTTFIQTAFKSSKFFHQYIVLNNPTAAGSTAGALTYTGTNVTNNALDICTFLYVTALSYYHNIKQYFMTSGKNVFVPMRMDLTSQYINIIDSINLSVDVLKAAGIDLCSSYLLSTTMDRAFVDNAAICLSSTAATAAPSQTLSQQLTQQLNGITEQFVTVLPTIYKGITTFISPVYSPHNAQTYNAALNACITLYKQALLVQQQYNSVVGQLNTLNNQSQTKTKQQDSRLLTETRAFLRQLFTRGSREIGNESVEFWVVYLDFLQYLQKQLANANSSAISGSATTYKTMSKSDQTMHLMQEISDVQKSAVKTLQYHLRSSFVDVMNTLQQTE